MVNEATLNKMAEALFEAPFWYLVETENVVALDSNGKTILRVQEETMALSWERAEEMLLVRYMEAAAKCADYMGLHIQFYKAVGFPGYALVEDAQKVYTGADAYEACSNWLFYQSGGDTPHDKQADLVRLVSALTRQPARCKLTYRFLSDGTLQWVTDVRSQGFNRVWTGNTIENSLGPALLAVRAAVLTVRDELNALLERGKEPRSKYKE